MLKHSVKITADSVSLDGDLTIPDEVTGMVLFAHGSGSSRNSPRNRNVAQVLQAEGMATLLMDLLTAEEEAEDWPSGHLRFNIKFLAKRLLIAASWLREQTETRHLRLGLFGASTGGGAALFAAAERPDLVRAVVSRGGRPDLAGAHLSSVQAPTLLIVGQKDPSVIDLTREALGRLRECGIIASLEIVPGATHLFEEPGTLEMVAGLSASWFSRYLRPDGASEEGASH